MKDGVKRLKEDRLRRLRQANPQTLESVDALSVSVVLEPD
jgi:hypothetical protein